MDKSPKVESVSSVMKVFSILQALSDGREVSSAELAQQTIITKSTAYRFLQTMKQLGFVGQNEATEKYYLTPKLFEVAAGPIVNLDLIKLADRQMRLIGEKTGEALHLAKMDGDTILYLHRIEPAYSLTMQCVIGKRNPLYSTAIGKVILAGRSDDEVREILKNTVFKQFTCYTHANVESLLEELELVRQQGFGEDNEEQEVGLRCIAAPVYDRFGQVTAGMSISLPSMRLAQEPKQTFVDLLQAAGKKVSEDLGLSV